MARSPAPPPNAPAAARAGPPPAPPPGSVRAKAALAVLAALFGAAAMYAAMRVCAPRTPGGPGGGGTDAPPANGDAADGDGRDMDVDAWARLAAAWKRELAAGDPAAALAFFRRHFPPGLRTPNHARLFADYAQPGVAPGTSAYLFLWETAGGTQYVAHMTVDADDRIVDRRADALHVDNAP